MKATILATLVFSSLTFFYGRCILVTAYDCTYCELEEFEEENALASEPMMDDLEFNGDTEEDLSLREIFCERNCFKEALSGEGEAGSGFSQQLCDSICPEYKLPEQALDPDAQCSRCPEANCLMCRCDTGICIVQKPSPEDRLRFSFDVSPVASLFCASCHPKRTCRRLWYCK